MIKQIELYFIFGTVDLAASCNVPD